jgi:small conductance mechanosensitive channel
MADDFFAPISTWTSHHYAMILIVLVVAFVAEYVGRYLIKVLISRSLHGHHFGRPKQLSAEVKKRQQTILTLALITWKTLVFIVALVAVMMSLFPTINILPFFASAGVFGAIIGFGAQSLIKDTLAGIAIIAENQFRVGDVVELEGSGVSASGTVEHISLRGTVLRDNDGNVHYFSNGNIMHVVNKTMGYSKVSFALSVSPDSDIDKTVAIIDKAGAELEASSKWQNKIIEPPHFINLGGLTDTAIELNISGKTVAGEQWAATSELKKRLLRELQQHKDIQLASSPGLNLSLLSGKKKK